MKTILATLLFAALSAQGQSVRLTWAASADTTAINPGTVNVYRAAEPCSASTAFTRLRTAVTDSFLVDTTGVSGFYCYMVTAVMNGVESGPSNMVEVQIPISTLPPAAPAGLAASVSAPPVIAPPPPVVTPPPVIVPPPAVVPMHMDISSTSSGVNPSPFPGLNRPCCDEFLMQLWPARGKYNWTPLDAWISQSKAHSARTMYTFNRTPVWASGSVTLPPKDVNAGDVLYKEFVTALMQHVCHVASQPSIPYAGLCDVKVFEAWNEFNGNGFWTGSYHDLAVMSNDAAKIIRTYCADCSVLAGSVSAGGDGYNPAGGSSHYDLALADFLTQWHNLPNASLPDGVSYHAYPARTTVRPVPFPTSIVSHSSSLCSSAVPSASCRTAIKDQPAAIRLLLSGTWAAGLPVWQTEGGYGLNASLVGSNPAETATLRQAYISQWMIVLAAAGVKENLAYAYGEQCWMTFNGTMSNGQCSADPKIAAGMTPIQSAWVQTAAWLANSTFTGPLIGTPLGTETIWTIPMTHNGSPAALSWFTGWMTTTSYNLPPGMTHSQNLAGVVTASATVPLGQGPVLLY